MEGTEHPLKILSFDSWTTLEFHFRVNQQLDELFPADVLKRDKKEIKKKYLVDYKEDKKRKREAYMGGSGYFFHSQ